MTFNLFKYILIFSWCFLSFFAFSQEKPTVKSDFFSLKEAIKLDSNVTNLLLDCDSASINSFLLHFDKFKNIEKIQLRGEADFIALDKFFSRLGANQFLQEIQFQNFEIDKLPNSISSLKSVKKILVKSSPNINYKYLFQSLASLPGLGFLVLENNGLIKVPREINGLQNLNYVKISGNPSLNLKQAFNVLSKMPALTELQLQNNDLTEISTSIKKFNKLESLDLSSNNITLLPDELSQLKKLKTLRLEGNYIADIVHELLKIKNPQLKYLTIDKGLSEEELAEIKKVFPSAQIREIDTIIESEIIDTNGNDFKSSFDSITVKEVLAQKIDTGTFRVQRNEIKALSNAYLYYPQLFDSRKMAYDFDSLLFDIRYSDTTYSGIWKTQRNQKYPNIVLEMYNKSPKGEVWFDFSRAMGYNRYLVKNNPEVNAFIGMKWVYLGDLKRKQFKRTYIKNKMWLDTRIYYNETNKNFTIELKEKSGFTTIIAYPRNADLRNPIENSQKVYAKKNERYLKVLQRREDKFHKKLAKEKSRYDKSYYDREAHVWELFRTQMSSKEKSMDREEWLAYYDEIMREEKKALYSSSANAGNFLRSMEIEGYKIISAVDFALKENVKEYNCTFMDERDKKIADSQVLMIAPGKKEIYVFEGNLGAKETSLFIGFNSNYKIVVELRSGHLAVCDEEDFQKLDFKINKLTIPVQTFDKNLNSVGKIRRELGLE